MGQQRFFKRGKLVFLAWQRDVRNLATGTKRGIATI
jgi:hypothetical protein